VYDGCVCSVCVWVMCVCVVSVCVWVMCVCVVSVCVVDVRVCVCVSVCVHMIPKQGDKAPWLNTQNYSEDKKLLATRAVDDGVLQFSNPVAASGDAEASHLESDAA